ncbi:MAG: adenine deaminase [Treponemataceae bacterium]
MNTKRLSKIIKVSKGEFLADLVIRNCKVVDPISQTISDGDIAIFDGYIVGVGDYRGKKEIDAKGAFATSGLIDAHVHIESSLCTPEGFAQLVIPFGTTCVVADPHEISNVKGVGGIHFMINSARKTPLKAYFMVPSCVPATNFEDAGAIVDARVVEELINEKQILGLGEMMNVPGVLHTDEDVVEKISLAINQHKPIDGHAPGVKGKDLNAYRVSGITTDHECINADQVRSRLKRGMYVLLRQGSAAQNLKDLLLGVTEANSRRCAMCSDDKHTGDILQNGHINHNLRLAVAQGFNVFCAIAMATINAAECYQLKNTGLIAPGFHADIVLFEDLKDFKVKKVFIDGEIVAKDGKPLFDAPNRVDMALTQSVNIAPIELRDLQIPIKNNTAKIIQLTSHDLITNAVERAVKVKDGFFDASQNQGIQKLFVIERHKATGKIGKGLIENYGAHGGAIATTIAHDSHNLIVAGDNDGDILHAISELEKVGGGITLVQNGIVLETLSLEIGGLMSAVSAPEISAKIDRMLHLAYEKLCVNREIEPFMTLSFLSLPVIPHIKLTPRGLFNVDTFEFMDV